MSVMLVDLMPLFAILVTLFSTYPRTDFRSKLFSQHTFLVAAISIYWMDRTETCDYKAGQLRMKAG